MSDSGYATSSPTLSALERAIAAGASTSPANMLEIGKIRRDGGTQPRSNLDTETVDKYALRMQRKGGKAGAVIVDPEGAQWANVEVFFDGTDYWLADGFHRLAAAEKAGYNTIQVAVMQGNQRDAIKHSLGVNGRHGLPRTNADKRRAVRRALLDEEWVKYSDRQIALMCRVSGPTVAKLRKELEETGDIEEVVERIGADGRSISSANIGTVKPLQSPKAVAPITRADLKTATPLPDDFEDDHNPAMVEVEFTPPPLQEVVTNTDSLRVVDHSEVSNIRGWGRIGHEVHDRGYDVLVAPLPMPIRWASDATRSTHLLDKERGVVLTEGTFWLVWSVKPIILPTSTESLDELVKMLEEVIR